jgi:hypothetical protein
MHGRDLSHRHRRRVPPVVCQTGTDGADVPGTPALPSHVSHEQWRAEQWRAMESRAMESNGEQSNGEKSREEQSRAEQSRAGQWRDASSRQSPPPPPPPPREKATRQRISGYGCTVPPLFSEDHSVNSVPLIIRMSMQYTSDEEERIAPTSPRTTKDEVAPKSSSSLALPALAAVTVAAAIGIGTRWFLGRRRGKQHVGGGASGKKSGRGVENSRRVPPRRARSVASSVDGGAVKRYVYCERRGGFAWGGRGWVGGVASSCW